eukprot:Skav225479  [mRNA]  locus=scaffold3604:245413:245856:- [translate_table: standard]
MYRRRIPYMSPAALFAEGLIDPKQTFIKQETHAAKKVATKRWRLIWIHSYVDSTIQRMLHSAQNEADVLRYHAGLPSSATIGLGHDDAGIRKFGACLDQLLETGEGKIWSADASGWDMAVSADRLSTKSRMFVVVIKWFFVMFTILQ